MNKRQDETIPAQGQTTTQERVPKLPHERDESATDQGAEAPSAQRVAEAARQDIEQGKQDTSKGPELGATYDRLRKSTPDPDKKFSP